MDAARDVGRVGRGLQHEMARAPIVNPDRRAVGGEQPVGAVAEDVEAGREVQRRRQAAGELVEQRAHVALQLLALAQVEQLERRHERVGGFDRVDADIGGRRRMVEADREQADALAAANQRQQQRGAASRGAPARSGVWRAASATSVGMRRANASATSAASSGPAARDRSAARRGRSPTWPAGRRCAGCAGTAASSEPPVTSSACWCRCGSSSFGVVLCASSDASGREAVPLAGRFRVSRGIDSGSVGRVMRDSTAIDRRPPTAGAGAPHQVDR